MTEKTDISLKEVFERVVGLEAKLDLMQKINAKTRKNFLLYVFLLIALLITNIFTHLFI